MLPFTTVNVAMDVKQTDNSTMQTHVEGNINDFGIK
jgi:hypothetical protein